MVTAVACLAGLDRALSSPESGKPRDRGGFPAFRHGGGHARTAAARSGPTPSQWVPTRPPR